MDSGLDREESTLIMEGRRVIGYLKSKFGGSVESNVHLLKLFFCAVAIAEHIDGRRESKTLAAGVLRPTDDGVMFGVGNGPRRANPGVGGASSGFGSKNRGRIVVGVGVLSCEVESK